jgi:asparagine synthase (glutamine-hydrolysing)
MANEKRRRDAVSAQFGRWNVDGLPADQAYLRKAEKMLAPYGPDGGRAFIKDNVGILCRAFHTTKESRRESQPWVTASGTVLTWDGRLDNRHELVLELKNALTATATDLAIVAAAHEAWGTKCFAKLIGDWALSVWDPRSRSVILAKDPIGTRHLYYSFDNKRVTWSTILDPLVLLGGKMFTLEEEYIAGWLSFFPATHLTPYVGIHSVPPSCFVRLEPERQKVIRYWDFEPGKRIRYRRDGEYEEHFRTVFGESVRRRLRANSPILAELSGGIDSSAIVCMADTVITRGVGEIPRLDTISYYNDFEPNWNERPYFIKVEEKRGRMGCHIDVGAQRIFKLEFETDRLVLGPGSASRPSEVEKQFAMCMTSEGNRVLFSGIGGDEVCGGVPTPIPELADLLARARFRRLAHQLKVWALNKRRPWFHLLFEAARGFFPPAFVGFAKNLRPAVWLEPNFVKRHRDVLVGYQSTLKLAGPLPSFQVNISALDMLRRQLGCEILSSNPPYEKRYPYLDRDLLEFLYAIPREQLVRPGQRRSLMRRALVGIVPSEILERKRKAFVSRAPIRAISTEWAGLSKMRHRMVSSSLGIIEPNSFYRTLQQARNGQEIPIVALGRAFAVEEWLKRICCQKILGHLAMEHRDQVLSTQAEETL